MHGTSNAEKNVRIAVEWKFVESNDVPRTYWVAWRYSYP